MAGRGREGTGRDGASGRGLIGTLLLCFCEGRRRAGDGAFVAASGSRTPSRTGMWRRRWGLTCQSSMRDIIGVPVVPDAHVVNQLDGQSLSPSPISA